MTANGSALLPIAWPLSISNQKNKTAEAIATVAAIRETIVILLICKLNLSRTGQYGARTTSPASIGPRRGATSGARAGGKFVSSRLLATIALVAASMVSAHAQTNWTGAFSNGWFNPGNWNAGVPTAATNANIDTATPNSTEVRGAGATALNLAVGQNGTGILVIQNGGTLTDFGGFVGNLPGSQGTVTVSGAGSTWTNVGTVVVGGLGTGTLTIQNGGMVSSGGGGSVGLSVGSTGTVTVTGPGSTWNNSPGGGLNIGSFGTGILTITNGGMVINNTAFTANIGNGAGSQGTVRVAGTGSTWSNSSGLNIGNRGAGTLTIAEGGFVTGPTVTIAANASSTGTLNIGAGAGNSAVAPGTLTAPSVAFGAGTGTINFNHTSADYVFAPAVSGNGTVNVLAGTTILTGDLAAQTTQVMQNLGLALKAAASRATPTWSFKFGELLKKRTQAPRKSAALPSGLAAWACA